MPVASKRTAVNSEFYFLILRILKAQNPHNHLTLSLRGKQVYMNQEKANHDDFIDLPPLKKITFQILQFFFSVLNKFSDVFRYRKILLSIGLVLGLIFGYFYYYQRSSNFELSMILESSSLTKGTVAEVVKNLNGLIGSQSYSKLANDLGITESQARKISYLQTLSMDNEPLENDTSTKLLTPFKLVAYVSQASISDTLQESLVQYLNNKLNIRRMTDEKVKINKEKLVFIDKELAKLDSLKSEYTRFLASSKISTTFYSNAFDPAEIYKQSSALMKDKEEVLSWLNTSAEPFIVIDEFKAPVRPRSASIGKALFLGATIGIAICFLFGLLLELNKMVNRAEYRTH
jgi:hypothetical protein